MGKTFAGFRRFIEDAGGPTSRPDQKHADPGKRWELDSIGVQAMELGVDPKDFESVPFVGANFQVGKQLLGGLSAWTVVDIDDKRVTLELRDEGSKRFLRTPSGVLARDPSPQDTPRRITIPRAYYIRMLDDQYASAGGAAGGMGGAIPPMI